MEPVQHFTPKYTPEQQAEMAAERERRRAEWEAIAQANQAWKRPLLLAGPPLRDVEAAMECRDSCHPSVRMETHDGGSTCHCQDTPEQKEARKAAARQALTQLTEAWQPSAEELAREAELKELFESTAAQLGVALRAWGGSVPFQIEGSYEGRSFYVRARHERFSIRVAPAEDPDMFLREPQEWGDGDWLIDEGGDETLFGGRVQDEVHALRYTVDRLRDFLHPAPPCPHVLTNEAGTIQFRFCPLCGIRTEDVTGTAR